MNIPLNPCNIMQMQPLFGLSAEGAQKNVERGRKAKKKMDFIPFLNKELELAGQGDNSSKVGTFEDGKSFLPFFQITESNERNLCTNLKEYTCERGRSTQDGVSCALLLIYGKKWDSFYGKSLDSLLIERTGRKGGGSASFLEIALKQMTASAVMQKDKEN